MIADRLGGFACALLAAGIFASAVLGPLLLGTIEFHVSRAARDQLVGGELVSLVLAGPTAVAAAVLWARGNPRGPMLAFAPALYAAYIYTQYIVGPQYERYAGNNERFFLLYAALVALGWLTSVRAWTALAGVPLSLPGAGLRKSLAVLLILLSAFFAAAWLGGVAQILRGVLPAGYLEDPNLFWVVRFMDLSLVIPAAIVVAVALFGGWDWSTRAAIAFTGFQSLLVAAVAGMAALMQSRRAPDASVGLLVATLTFAVLLTAAFVGLARASR
jgi:hypothetical protein